MVIYPIEEDGLETALKFDEIEIDKISLITGIKKESLRTNQLTDLEKAKVRELQELISYIEL